MLNKSKPILHSLIGISSIALGAALFACSGLSCTSSDDSGGGQNSDAAAAPSDASSIQTDAAKMADASSAIDWSALNGTQPSTPKSLIDFSALNYDESARSKEDLLGQPTILWFFPFATTPG